MAMGAFLAGVLLASSGIDTRLKVIIGHLKGLLLGLFSSGRDVYRLWHAGHAHPLRILILLVGFMVIKMVMWLIARPS